MAGQSVMDRVAAVKHSIAGQGLAKSVCKATTEEIIGPKKKHLDYLLQCTNEPNVSIPQMADLLIERTQHASWVVVFKSLISIHNLMNHGNERFTQYLASNNCSFSLSGFVDKGGVQGYDMSTYIRRYAKYLNEKAVSYRSMAFDFCKVKRGKEDGLLRTMNAEKLLKTLPVLQQQLDALLEFDCTPNELTNGVITACFMLLFKDLIRLFACYNDGIINLLEKFFDMNKKQCKDALDVYKRFLVRMDKVSEFLKVAENMGIDKGDIPDLAKAPASLLDALEQHLASLEGKKSVTTPTSSAKPSGFTTALNNMSSNTFTVSEAEKKRILDEENQQLQKHKGVQQAGDEGLPAAMIDIQGGEEEGEESGFEQSKENQSPQKLSSVAAASNPFTAGSPSGGQPNLFGSPVDNSQTKLSDDLLSLGSNPFVGNTQDAVYTAPVHSAPNTGGGGNPFGTPAFQTNGYSSAATSSNNFTSDADFAKAFNSTGTTNSQQGVGFDSSQGTVPAVGPPGLDLGIPLDSGSCGEDPVVLGMPSVSSMGMPLDISGSDGTLQQQQQQPPSISPMAPSASGLGGPFSDLEGLDQPLSISPSPSPFGGLTDLSGLTGDTAPPPLASPFGMAPSTVGFGSGAGGVSPVMMPMAHGGSFMGGMMNVPSTAPPSYMGHAQPAPAMPSAPMSVPVGSGGPGAKLGMGMSGSPIRIMTRGGVSPGPSSSLSSSPSGPGLEDAVKALGLSMSPSKGGTAAGKARGGGGGLMTGGGQNRPTSPGQSMMSMMKTVEPVVASGQAAPIGGGLTGFGEEGEAGDTMLGAVPSEAMSGGEMTLTGFDAFGEVMAPMNKSPSHQAQTENAAKPIGSDLDSSLASLASNLNVGGGTGQLKKDHQWQPKGENKLTGGSSFQRQPIAASTTAAAAPAPQWGAAPAPGFQQPPMMPGAQGVPMMYGQQMGMPMGQPMMGMTPQPMMQPGMMGMGHPQQPMMYGAGPQRMPSPAMGNFGQQPQAPAHHQSTNAANDPFGAL